MDLGEVTQRELCMVRTLPSYSLQPSLPHSHHHCFPLHSLVTLWVAEVIGPPSNYNTRIRRYLWFVTTIYGNKRLIFSFTLVRLDLNPSFNVEAYRWGFDDFFHSPGVSGSLGFQFVDAHPADFDILIRRMVFHFPVLHFLHNRRRVHIAGQLGEYFLDSTLVCI